MIDILNKGWVGILVGFIGAFYFYRKSLRIPDPRVSIKSDHALTWSEKDELPKGVEIRFRGEPVPRIARSVVRIWNAGSGCLTKDHVSENDPLRFVLENGGKFLDAVLVKESNPASKCEINIREDNPSEVLFSLDFLNQDEGVTIGLIHTDLIATPIIKGSLKGYSLKVTEEAPRKKLHGYRKWLFPLVSGWAPVFLGLLMMGFGLIGEEQIHIIRDWMSMPPPICPSRPMPYVLRAFVLIVGVSYVLIGSYYFWRNRRTYPKSLMIKSSLNS